MANLGSPLTILKLQYNRNNIRIPEVLIDVTVNPVLQNLNFAPIIEVGVQTIC